VNQPQHYAVKYFDGQFGQKGPWVTYAVTQDRAKAFRIRASLEREQRYAKVFKADEELVRIYLTLGNKLW